MNINKNIYNLVRENLAQILLLREERVSKEDGSYVTKGDLLCQNLIMDYLKTLGESFVVVSEEMDLKNFVYDEEKDYIVLDPIDGTENFTSGLKEWGISVSVFKKGRHSESMIMLPELDLCLTTGDKIERFDSRICGLSSSLNLNDLSKLESGYEYRIMGCCVYNMYNVVTGSYARFENPLGAWAWDISAGLNLALEHGLEVIVDDENYQGGFLSLNKKHSFKVKNNYA